MTVSLYPLLKDENIGLYTASSHKAKGKSRAETWLTTISIKHNPEICFFFLVTEEA